MSNSNLSELRLYQLISPSLPIGSFTYSQGLEWAIEAQWITDKSSLKHWLTSILNHSIVTLELPILMRLISAFQKSDEASVARWTQWLIACRETAELRKEEQQRGAALARLLPNLGVSIPDNVAMHISKCQLTGFALAAYQWGIDAQKLCYGYCWGWLENIVLAGVKLIPLGQTDGQKIMFELAEEIPSSVEKAVAIKDFDIHSSTPALAIASSRHETQYTRLFRS